MREWLLGALIQGDKVIWAVMAALWLCTATLVVFRRSSFGRGAPATRLRVFTLLAATTVTSLAALPLAAAVAIPRIRWKNVGASDLYAPNGDTWRRLQGPAVQVTDRGAPDVAIPALVTVDAQDRWMLVGLLSGRPVEGLGPAPDAPLETGVPRICRADGESCRPWPSSWPDPSRPIGMGELVWTREASMSALAYDTETGHYLRAVAGVSEADRPPPEASPTSNFGSTLELAGRIANNPPREGTSVLFILRSVAHDRLHGVRVVSVASAGGSHAFHLQRADVSLTTGPRAARWFALPALLLTSLALPVGLALYLYVTLSSRRRRGLGALEALSQRSSGRLNKLSAIAAFAAGIAAGAPAVVAIASLWGSR